MSDQTPRPPSRAAEQRADFPWLLEMPTRWLDNDRYGHMNNAHYYTVFENAVMRFLEVESGLDPNNGSTRCFTVENGCTYHDAVRFPDDLEVGLRVARIGRSSVRYELGIFVKNRNEVAATGYIADVFVDSEHERPIPVPTEFRIALTPLMTAAASA